MFNRKLKLKIAELDRQLQDAKSEISKLNLTIDLQAKDIQKLEYQLSNPPKYGVGDKVGDYVVISRIYKTKIDRFILGIALATYGLFPFNQKARKAALDLCEKNRESQWRYEVVNMKTKELSVKDESELV